MLARAPRGARQQLLGAVFVWDQCLFGVSVCLGSVFEWAMFRGSVLRGLCVEGLCLFGLCLGTLLEG